MAKALEIKRKHHYVWAFYLRQWESDEKGVWYRTPKIGSPKIARTGYLNRRTSISLGNF